MVSRRARVTGWSFVLWLFATGTVSAHTQSVASTDSQTALVGALLSHSQSTLTATVVLQSVNRDLIDNLYVQLLYVALPLTLFVLVILVYSVVRFRDNDDPQPTAEDPPLEITWTAATAIILLFVGVSSYAVLANPYLSPGIQSDDGFAGTGENPIDVPDEDTVVEVTAYQFEWQFTHEETVTTQNELVVPADEDVTLLMTSRDVIHTLAIPDLGVRQDVFPEQETAIRTNVHTTGEYEAMCTEFCGAHHAYMQATVTVVDQETYEEWLEEHEDEDGVVDPPVVED